MTTLAEVRARFAAPAHGFDLRQPVRQPDGTKKVKVWV
jgi:hypothetical protein